MNRILALQALQPSGPDMVVDDPALSAASSCSYVGCGACSTVSFSGCKPAPLMIVTS